MSALMTRQGASPAENIWSPQEFENKLRSFGESHYHHKHPFHALMHEGKLTRGQLQAWILNRYYYQSRIPIKDSIILSRSEDIEFRRVWIKRVTDHDGRPGEPAKESGGIEKWLKLGEAAGLSREEIVSCRSVLPGVRFAVDAYVQLTAQKSLLEAVASSLTELFSKDMIAFRIPLLRKHYAYLAHGLDYFVDRMPQIPPDATFALAYVIEHARTREQQELVARALQTKCEILWSQLDALHLAYVQRLPPPGAKVFA